MGWGAQEARSWLAPQGPCGPACSPRSSLRVCTPTLWANCVETTYFLLQAMGLNLMRVWFQGHTNHMRQGSHQGHPPSIQQEAGVERACCSWPWFGRCSVSSKSLYPRDAGRFKVLQRPSKPEFTTDVREPAREFLRQVGRGIPRKTRDCIHLESRSNCSWPETPGTLPDVPRCPIKHSGFGGNSPCTAPGRWGPSVDLRRLHSWSRTLALRTASSTGCSSEVTADRMVPTTCRTSGGRAQ